MKTQKGMMTMEGKIEVCCVAQPCAKLPMLTRLVIAANHEGAAGAWLQVACLLLVAALAPASFAGMVVCGAIALFALNLAVGWSAASKHCWVWDPEFNRYTEV